MTALFLFVFLPAAFTLATLALDPPEPGGSPAHRMGVYFTTLVILFTFYIAFTAVTAGMFGLIKLGVAQWL